MNATTELYNQFPLTRRGFFFACEYLLTDNALVEGYALTVEELMAYLSFPNGRRETFVSIIQRANKLRSEAHRKAMAIRELK